MVSANVGYIRISKAKEDIKNQEYALEKFAGEPLVFFEDIITGAKDAEERTGFQKMLEYIEKFHPERVYVYEISRIGRSFFSTLKIINELEKKYNVRILSASPKETFMNTLDPNMRDLVLSVLAWVAERERDILIARTKNSLDRKKAELNEKGFFISRRGKKITKLGRPERNIDWNAVEKYRSQGYAFSVICKLLGYNYQWFIRKKRQKDLNSSNQSTNRGGNVEQ